MTGDAHPRSLETVDYIAYLAERFSRLADLAPEPILPDILFQAEDNPVDAPGIS